MLCELRTALVFLEMVILSLVLTGPAGAAGVGADLLKMPLRFEPTGERSDTSPEFVARGPGYGVQILPTEVRLQLRGQPSINAASPGVRLNFLGGNPEARLNPADELPGKVNYFNGNDPSRWRTSIPTFAKVKSLGVYPGIDLEFYGNEQQLEFDCIIAPGASPNDIAFALEGAEHTIRPQNDGGLLRKRLNGSIPSESSIP